MNPDSAHHDIADARSPNLLNPHLLAEFAAASGYGITIRRNTGEDDPPAVGRRAQTQQLGAPLYEGWLNSPASEGIAGSKAPSAGYRPPRHGCDTLRPSPGVEVSGSGPVSAVHPEFAPVSHDFPVGGRLGPTD